MPKITQEIECPNCSAKIPLTFELGELAPPMSEAEKRLTSELALTQAKLLEVSERLDASQVPPDPTDPPTPEPTPEPIAEPETDVFGDG